MHTPNEAHDRWDSGELGLSAEHAVVAEAGVEREVDDAFGLQMISIRLPKRLIEDLKLIAGKEGLGYQPLIRTVLLRFAEAEFRNMAHERLAATVQAQKQEPALENEPRVAVGGCR